MLTPHQIAMLEEARIALALSELAPESLSVGGGTANCGGSPDSWMNLVVGVAMEQPLTANDVDRIVAFYAERRISPKVEVCPFADPSLAHAFGQRGFILDSFETVLWRDLQAVASPALPDGVVFECVEAGDDAALEAFVVAHVACFAPEGGARAEAMAVAARRVARHPRTRAWIVRVHGQVAGGGALEVLGTLGTLIAGGVTAPFRRRGLQLALIEHRCAVAYELGCAAVTIGSKPWGATGRNALRAGFVTAYTKAILAGWKPNSVKGAFQPARGVPTR